MGDNVNINVNLDINELYKDSLDPVVKRVSKTIISLWDLTFGQIDHINEKYQLKKSYETGQFKNQLESKINGVPRENLIAPKFSIVGPVLESSKFYFEEPELREMFANLIASSMNSEKTNDARVSFSKIIQQLTPLDAHNLSLFRHKYSLPIAKNEANWADLRHISQPRSLYVFFGDPNYPALCETISASLDNLERLGLVKIEFDRWYQDSVYDNYRTFEKIRIPVSSPDYNKYAETGSLKIEKGIISITTLGDKFINVCL